MIASGAAGPEMSADPRFAARVRRLAGVSSIALGVIFGLATVTSVAPPVIRLALAFGWFLMPTILYASLWRPALRYRLVLPASLVSLALLAIAMWSLPTGTVAATGWAVLAAGVLVGGGSGLWFWYRLLPVPAALDDPFSLGRWTLIGLHIGLVVAGAVLVGLPFD